MSANRPNRTDGADGAGSAGAVGRLRRVLLLLAAAGIAATAAELAMQRHWESTTQLVPWLALAVLAVAFAVALRVPTPRRRGVVQVLAIAVALSGAWGVVEHVRANYAAGPLDFRYANRWETMSPLARWWAAATESVGPSPTLAPAILAQAAICLWFAIIPGDPRHRELLTGPRAPRSPPAEVKPAGALRPDSYPSPHPESRCEDDACSRQWTQRERFRESAAHRRLEGQVAPMTDPVIARLRDRLPVNQPSEGLVAEAYDVWIPVDDEFPDDRVYLELLEEVDGLVLELGCGTGRPLRWLATGHDVEGIDNSLDVLAILCRHAAPSEASPPPTYGSDGRLTTTSGCGGRPAAAAGNNGLSAQNAGGSISSMPPTVDEIAEGIYRISTWVPEVTPEGFTFNQFLVVADEPLLFHTGPRGMFPQVAEAMGKVVPVESLRWIIFGHVEADECGSMNLWLAAAPESQVAHNALACGLSLNDLCDRPPRVLGEGELVDLGGKRVRQISMPHVPHGWESQVLYEETTATLLCGDLFTHIGGVPALTTDDVVGPALDTESIFHASTLAPHTARTLRELGDLNPTTLAIMHGSSFRGDGKQALYDLAAGYERLTAQG